MKIKLLRTFLPSMDYMISKEFYKDLGFDIIWESDELTEFGTAEYNFFLQNYYQKDWANNLMMQMFVDDLDSLYQIAKSLINKYKHTKIKPIFDAEYGRTFHLIGPAGELWHMTEMLNKDDGDPSKLICEDK